MKPISVRFKCFGPYMDQQVIDFSQLEKNGLFLICGETGAGKTTILDAICYALYCESSGGLRGDIETMRCKLAGKQDETEVEFVFQSNGACYKFVRAMKYKTKNLHKYHTCYIQNGEVWEVLDTGLAQVTARAEALVGLTSSQFRQVIILPQGKFEEFLVSDSRKKEEILVTLFNVQQWSRICEEISRRVNRRAEEVNREKTAIAEALRRYGCDSLEVLGEKREALAISLADTVEREKTAAAALEQAEGAYAAAELDGAAFSELKRREKHYEELKSRSCEMEREAKLLQQADEAERLRQDYAEYTRAGREETRTRAAQERAQLACDTAAEALVRAEKDLSDHRNLLPEQTERLNRQVQMEQAREVYESLEKLEKEWETAKSVLEQADAKYAACSRDLEAQDLALSRAFAAQEEARETYNEAQIRYRLGIGGILAQTLELGKPCPVCGSTDHPMPAGQTEDPVSEAQLDQLNKALSRCDKAVSDGMKARAGAETARAAAQELRNSAQQGTVLAESRLETARKQKIPGIETARQLDREIRELNQKIRDYEAREKALNSARTAAEAEEKAAKLALANAQETLTAARLCWEIQQSRWIQALEQSCFGEEAAFREACMEPTDRQHRYRALADWQAQLALAGRELEAQRLLLADRREPDLAAVKETRDAAAKTYRSLSEKRILEDKSLKDITAEEKRLALRRETCRAAQRQLEEDQVFARRLSGSHGVGLQRYVLGVMMNSIAAQANRLLEHVYGGRYRLYRTDETSGRVMKGGLELEVYDSHNQQRRSVRTLSGGEKFLVALSLAIGLSTVVQAQGEGIRLEAMFIDEGFGSLDRESIADALEILQGIRRSAGVVGIISHVEALAETIPTRIEITKGKNGSSCHITQ